MKVLVIGQGGREHAIVKALSLSPSITEIHAIPGNDGMSRQAICHDMDWRKTEDLIHLCLRTEIDFVFIGPEDPLVAGLADRLRERGILCVGPDQEAARLEGSKIYAKEFMHEAHVPTAASSTVSSVDDVKRELSKFKPPYVLKANGLAAGKGVFICRDEKTLLAHSTDIFEKKTLGTSGDRALLEQFMPGWELSYIILTNGTEFQTLPLAQDHKRLADGDEGPNTGGMGTFAPMPLAQDVQARIDREIVEPTLKLIRERGLLFRGVLFIGLMMTDEGPSVLEYNVRFGDPETQVILPLIDGDAGQIFFELARGKMMNFRRKSLCAGCIVLAAEGYPDHPVKGTLIEGALTDESDSRYFLHAGTRRTEAGWTVNGGRVLGAVGLGSTAQEALSQAYEQAGKASWKGVQFRRDIGKAVLTNANGPQGN